MESSSRSINKRIIILGGWSPGPLLHLERAISSWQNRHHHQQYVEIVQVHNLSMPPIPGSWCCHPAVVAVFAIWIGLIYLAASPHVVVESFGWTIVLRLLLAMLAFVWFRIIAVVVVRVSMNQCIRIACKEMYQKSDPNQMLLIGFSWGGAVS